jgi:uncharacterized protein (DUF2236 family)
MTTTTDIGVTGSFHTTTLHGRFVSTASPVITSMSDSVLCNGVTAPTTPVSQTIGRKESDEPYSGRHEGNPMSTMGWVNRTPARLRHRANRSIRNAIGLNREPVPACNDPALAYFPVDGVARIVHGDLSSMLVGGLGSLFLQMLHPHAMAGVAQHSRYQADPLGRLLQTANFIGHTTYGTAAEAHADIERVLAVHQGVRGVADDGEPYNANDPHLLAWVHACEVSMFLAGYQRFGALTITDDLADVYVMEMAQIARDLGAENPPTTVAELRATIEAFRPELRLSRDGATARDFVANGVARSAAQRMALWLLVNSSFTLMAPWARDTLGVSVNPVRNRLVVRPATAALCRLLRVAVPPAKPFRSRG